MSVPDHTKSILTTLTTVTTLGSSVDNLKVVLSHDCDDNIKMGSPIEPGNLVSQRYANFRKTVWMTIVHLPIARFRIKHWKFSEIATVFRPLRERACQLPDPECQKCIIHIHTVLEGFVRWTRRDDFILIISFTKNYKNGVLFHFQITTILISFVNEIWIYV